MIRRVLVSFAAAVVGALVFAPVSYAQAAAETTGGNTGGLLAIAASVEGIARNPSAGAAIRGAMIIGLALVESLVIYALVIAFIMVFKG